MEKFSLTQKLRKCRSKEKEKKSTNCQLSLTIGFNQFLTFNKNCNWSVTKV